MQYDDEAIPASEPLKCADCEAVAEPHAEGWKGYLGADGTVLFFCPECAEWGVRRQLTAFLRA